MTGWFPVARADLATIRDHAGERDIGTIVCVWLALLDIGNMERATSFTATIGRIARTSGYSYRATARVLKRLEGFGLLRITARRLDGTNGFDASEYEVLTTVSPSADSAQPSADSAQPSERKPPRIVPKKITSKNKETSCVSPETFEALASVANEGRLNPEELKRFCGYWLEKSPSGKCRFQSQKFFEMPRRIATWASRCTQRQASFKPSPTTPATGLKFRED